MPTEYIVKYGCYTNDAFSNRTLEAFSIGLCTGNNPTSQIVTSNNSANNQIQSVGGNDSGTFNYDTSGNTLDGGLSRYWCDAEVQLCAEPADGGRAPVIGHLSNQNTFYSRARVPQT